MNYGIVFYCLGWVLSFEALFLVPPSLCALIYKEKDGLSLVITMLICLCFGMFAIFFKPKKKRLYSREGFVIVALSWFVLSLFGALPFRLSGYIPHMIDAVFETASGFTTTGASILSDVESWPRSLLFWRSFTHWIGGMGVLVFVIAILPLAGGSDMFLMKAESPGPSVKKLVPKVKNTAGALYSMYMVITLIEILFLLAGRMPLYESLLTAFGTAGTGGFGFLNDSMARVTVYQQVVITIFMILFGVNFNAYFLIYQRKFKDLLGMSEVIAYFSVIIASIILISININGMYPHTWIAVKDAAFQVGSIITTTGFSTADFNLWPSFSKGLLVTLMFVGACAGSTGGGIKVSRVLIMAKTLKKEILFYIHPNSVRKIKVDGRQLEHSVLRATNVFLCTYLFVFVFSFLIITLDNFDLETSFTAVAATLNNIGPGLSKVGPSANFAGMSYLSKIVLTFDMIAGRLELFPVLILFTRSTWKK